MTTMDRQVVFTIPKMLRIFFKYKRRLLGDLCREAVNAFLKLTFVAERPPPPHIVSQELLMDSEAPADYFS